MVGMNKFCARIIGDCSIDSWIIDSGVSQHMTEDKSLLFNIRRHSAPHGTVQLPLGEKTPITHYGTCRHGDTLRIDYVLYDITFHY